MYFKYFSLLLLALLLSAGSFHASAQNNQNLEMYISPDRTFALYKPSGWTVGVQDYPHGRVISCVDETNTLLALTMLFTLEVKKDSAAFAYDVISNFKKTYPDFTILRAGSTKDKVRTVVDLEYKDENGEVRCGRQYYTVKYPTASVLGYEAPKSRFKTFQPLLITIISNVTFLNPSVFEQVQAPQENPYTPYSFQMTQVNLPDGSASFCMPQSWGYIGKAGKVICESSDGGSAGFAFSSTEFLGSSRVPYFDSSTVAGVLHYEYMQPVEAVATSMKIYGFSNISVIDRVSNGAKAQALSALINNRGAEAEIALLSFTGKNGVSCKGFFDTLTLQPTYAGQWGVIFMGAWAPVDQFDRYLPTLAMIAESFGIDEAWSQQYIKSGAENLKRLAQQTVEKAAQYSAEIQQSSMERWQEKFRSSNYLDYKTSQYIRGEQEWINEAEGGKLYTSDHWGLSTGGQSVVEGSPFNYPNFNGEHPTLNTNMTPVDNRATFEKAHGVYGQ